jgi:hypothetical protein
MSTLSALLAFLVSSFQSAVISTRLDERGTSYVALSDRGVLYQLDASGLKPRVGEYAFQSDSLVSGERLLPRIVHMSPGSSDGFIRGVQTGALSEIRWVSNSAMHEAGVPGLQDFLRWGDSLVVLAAGQVRVTTAKWSNEGIPSFAPVSPSLSGVAGIEVTGDTLWAGFADGHAVAIARGGLTTNFPAPTSSTLDLPNGPVVVAFQGGVWFAGIQRSGRLVWWTTDQVVHDLGGQWHDLAFFARSGTSPSLRSFGRSSEFVEWDLNVGSRRWLMAGMVGRFGFLRDGSGRRLADQAGQAPSGWAWIGETISRVFGLYHHEGGMAVTRFDLDPNPWSPRKIPSLLVRYAAVGNQRCSSQVTLHGDSGSSAILKVLQPSKPLRYGLTDLAWDGTSASGSVATSGRYWADLRIWADGDTASIWKSIDLDREAAAGAPRWVGATTQDTVLLRLTSHDSVDWSAVIGVPSYDSVLQRSMVLVRESGEELRFPLPSQDSIQVVSAVDPLGLPLDEGLYRVRWDVRDSAGNDTSWSGPWLRVRAFRPFLQGGVVPLILTSTVGRRGSINWSITGTPGDSIRVSLDLDGEEVATGVLSSVWQDSLVILDGSGQFKWVGSIDGDGLLAGPHEFLLTVKNSLGDSASRELPFGVERIDTRITSPQSGEIVQGTVEVRGVATAPTLSSGFDGYWAYWTSGKSTPTSTDSTIETLLQGGQWHGLPVPLANQSRKVSNRPDRDLSWPASNRAVEPVTSEGTLAWFNPGSTADTGWFTLLVVSKETLAGKSKISWASEQVRWVGADSTRTVLEIVDSLQSRDTSKLDQALAGHEKDSTVLRIRSSGGFHGDWILLDGNGGSMSVPVSRGRVTLAPGAWTRWVFNGQDPVGNTLDSGLYTLVLEGTNAAGKLLRASRGIVFSPGDAAASVPLLQVAPSVVTVVPSIGLIPSVRISVANPNEIPYHLEIRNSQGDSLVRLVTDSKLKSAEYVWNLAQIESQLLNALNSNQTFEAVWIPLVEDGSLARATIQVKVDTSIDVDTSVSVFAIPDGDSVWHPETTSKFKFRALARGSLNYFPDRRVFVAPYATGSQVIRTFVSVPWHLEYRKFYNSVDIIATGQYSRSGYTDGEGIVSNKRWERYVDVEGNAVSSYYNFGNSRGVRVVDDSSLADWNDPILFYGDSTSLNLPVRCDKNWLKGYDYGSHNKLSDMRRECENDIQQSDVELLIRADDSLRAAGRNRCKPFYSLNTLKYEDPDDNLATACRVFAPSNTGEIADKKYDDVWTSAGGRVDFPYIVGHFYQPTSGAQGLSSGTEMFRVKVVQNSANPIDPKDARPVDMSTINAYWMKRTSRHNGWATNYALHMDEWDNDAEFQGNYLRPLALRWEHPYYFLKGLRVDSLNIARMRAGRRVWDDIVPWQQSSGTANNGGELSDSSWNMDDGKVITGFAGRKVGIRGFAYRATPEVKYNKWGRPFRQDEYIKNFWDRSWNSGMAYWGNQFRTKSDPDNLSFRPVLRMDDSVFGVTWDTVSIAFPFGDLETNASLYWDKDSLTDSIFAFVREKDVDWHEFPDLVDTARSVLLRASGLMNAAADYVDSVDVDLLPYFQKVLQRTDSTQEIDGEIKKRYFGYLRRNSLQFDIPLRSLAQGPGQGGVEIDTSGLYHAVQVIEHPSDSSLVARVYYRNKKTRLGNWSSALDSTFKRTSGWLYGSQEFNKDQFVGEARAIAGGFVNLVQPDRMPEPSPSTMSPFVRATRVDGTHFVEFNNNLTVGDFHWDLEVYFADGSSPNLDLDTTKTDPDNFALQILPDRSNKTWASLRGNMPDSVTRNGARLPFRSYDLYVRKSGDSIGFLPIPVNRFFVSETGSGIRGDIHPSSGLDFWESDTSIPALAWWDVSNKVGRHDVLLAVRYGTGTDSVMVVQRRSLVLGTVIADSATVNSPYRRASLQMRPGSTEPGTSISLTTVSLADVLKGGSIPEVQPLGPILKVSTTGNRNFEEDTTQRPFLTVRLLASEVYEAEGRVLSADLTFESIRSFLDSAKFRYLIHLLNETGRMDAAPTVATVVGNDVASLHLELTAQPSHFSLALVLREDGHQGRMPTIKSLDQRMDSLSVTGLYDGILAPLDSIRFDSLPEDLECVVRSVRTGDTTAVMGPLSLAVDSRGGYSGSLDISTLAEGEYALLVRYRGSSKAARTEFWKSGDTLRLTNWSFLPDSVRSTCGSDSWTTSFTANRTSSGEVLFLSPDGTPRFSRPLSVEPGSNVLGWDGCIEGRPAQPGVWTLAFRFGAEVGSDRSVRVGVGLRGPGLRSLTSTPNPWQPSKSNPAHLLTINSRVHGYVADSLRLEVRRRAGNELVELPLDATAKAGEYRSTWNGRFAGAVADTGRFVIVLMRRSDSTERLETEFSIGREIEPMVQMTVQPDSLVWPVSAGQVRVSSSRPVLAEVWLEDALGNKRSLTPAGARQVSTQPLALPWSWTDSIQPPPVMAIVRWSNLQGASGLDTTAIGVAFARPQIDSMFWSPGDSIFPDFQVRKISSQRSGQFPTSLEYGFSSDRAFRCAIDVVDARGRLVRSKDTLTVPAGLMRATWNAKDSADSLVSEGMYRVRLWFIPEHNADRASLLRSISIFVARKPMIVLTGSTATVRSEFASTVAATLKAKGITSWILDPAMAVDVLDVYPDQTIALLDAVADTSLFAGSAWNRIFRLVRSGGRVAFHGALPLSRMHRQGMDDSVSFGPTLALLGLANPYEQPGILNWKSRRLVSKDHLVKWCDSSRVGEMTPFFDQKAAPALDFDSLSSNEEIWARISGFDSTQIDTINGKPKTRIRQFAHGFYGRPKLYAQDTAKQGAVLCVHPFGARLDQPMAEEFGKEIYRFFFTQDLSIAPFQVGMPSVSGRRVVKRNELVPVRLRFAFLGDSTLDSAVLRLKDPANAGFDTTLVFRDVSFRSKKDSTVFLRVDSLAAFGSHKLTVTVDPFKLVVRDPNDTSIVDTVVEPNSLNNLVQVEYMVRDTIAPWIVMDRADPTGFLGYLSTRTDARPRIFNGVVKTRHGLGEVTVQASYRRNANVLGDDSVDVSAFDGKWDWSAPMTLDDSLFTGTRQLVLRLTDIFGEHRDTVFRLDLDTTSPVIERFRIEGVAYDSSSLTPRCLLDGPSNLVYSLTMRVRDNVYLGSYELSDPPDSTHAEIDSLFWEGIKDVSVDGTQMGTWILKAWDEAGNPTQSEFEVDIDTSGPVIKFWKVTGRTFLDSLLADDSASFTYGEVQRKPLRRWEYQKQVSEGDTVSRLATLDAFEILPDGRGERVYKRGPGELAGSFILTAGDQSFVQLRYWWDSDSLSAEQVYDLNPYLRIGSDSLLQSAEYASAVRNHPLDHYLRLAFINPGHKLTVEACDAGGRCVTQNVFFESDLADLQVIDSTADGSGADWSEVYMRRSHQASSGSTLAETWDYWLIHRLNPLTTEIDAGVYRLIVDADNDSTTGDQASPGGYRGADVAIEWWNQGVTDDGNSIRFRKLVWDSASSTWAPSMEHASEGIFGEDGVAFDANQQDDPQTDSLGEGDQRLPSGKVARASNGMIELGLRSGNSGNLSPIRWAIVPIQIASDTVRDSTGGMLVFTPKRFKEVTVDGRAPDWGLDNSLPAVEAYSLSSGGEPGTIRLWVKNPGTVPVNMSKLTYWIHSTERPTVLLDSVPRARALILSDVRLDSSKGLDQWRVELTCGSCQIVGGQALSSLGLLRVTGDAASTLGDDWSQAPDTAAPNARLPLYAPDGHILWGSEPPTKTTREPLARISPSGSIWTSVGQRVILSGSQSFDPEGQPLRALWRVDGSGSVDTGWIDTLEFARPGRHTVQLEVVDRLHLTRKSWASVDIFVEDPNGQYGDVPLRDSTMVIFDDRWASDWDQNWLTPTRSVSLDSVMAASGSLVERLPVRGDSMVSLGFDSSNYITIRARCDSSFHSWCNDELDVSTFTNLEFFVASDAGLRRPIRVWLTRGPSLSGHGIAEEKFAYISTYLPEPLNREAWQKVSIPLKDLFTDAKPSSNGWLQLKVMVDEGNEAPAHRSKVLLDQIELVRYRTAPGDVVTTRKQAIQVLANTVDQLDEYVNELGMAVRLLNAGSLPIALDSLRVRHFFKSRDGDVSGDTLWRLETPTFFYPINLPLSVNIDRDLFQAGAISLAPTESPVVNATHSADLGWAHPAGRELTLENSGTAAYWMQVGSYNDSLRGKPGPLRAPLLRFAGTQSLHWSWPDSSIIWQFAPRIVVDAMKPDGTWGRIWGIAPNEDPQSVTYWNRESLRDPSEAVSAATKVRAKIRVLSGDLTPGSRLQLSADSSSDPLGKVLGFHWIDEAGNALQSGPSFQADLPTSGLWVVRLKVFDLADPTRSGTDSISLELSLLGAAIDSSAILRSADGSWSFQESWGGGVEHPTWIDSIDLPSRDGNCAVRLKSIDDGAILKLPFGSQGFTGVKFGTPVEMMERDRWTHLEFWVASGREWEPDADMERPIRIWLNQQVRPETGANNYESEEDFSILDAYLPKGHLKRHWQKVSIPLVELIQSSEVSQDRTQWFLKFMKNVSHNGSDTARDADLFLSGIRFARHSSSYGLVTTRRVGAVAMGVLRPRSHYGSWHGTLRLLNPSASNMHSDSLRIRFLGNQAAMQSIRLAWNATGAGTDESVSKDWFEHQSNVGPLDTPVMVDGMVVDGQTTVSWNNSLPLMGTRGWQGLVDLYWTSASMEASLQWFRPRSPSMIEDVLFHRVVVEQRAPNGTWKRLWGRGPGETWDEVLFDGRAELVMPIDTSMPSGVAIGLGCDDTIPSDTLQPPVDTALGPNHTTSPGVVAELPSMGRDNGLTLESVVAYGAPGVQVNQTRPDWSVRHRFIFDSLWARNSKILVDVFVPTAQLTSGSWIGTLTASTFDSARWLVLSPNGGQDLSSAAGTWQTLEYEYDASQYVLGKAFDLQFLANGHGAGTGFSFVLGAIRLQVDSSLNDSGSGGGGVPNPPSVGFSMDSLSGWETCHSCEIRSTATGGTGIAVSPNGGAPIMERTLVVDAGFRAGRYFELDVFSEFLISDWETVNIILVNGASGMWWDAHEVKLTPAASGTGGAHLQIPYDGSRFQIGTATSLRIVVNANAPAGSKVLLDNLTWVP